MLYHSLSSSYSFVLSFDHCSPYLCCFITFTVFLCPSFVSHLVCYIMRFTWSTFTIFVIIGLFWKSPSKYKVKTVCYRIITDYFRTERYENKKKSSWFWKSLHCRMNVDWFEKGVLKIWIFHKWQNSFRYEFFTWRQIMVHSFCTLAREFFFFGSHMTTLEKDCKLRYRWLTQSIKHKLREMTV